MEDLALQKNSATVQAEEASLFKRKNFLLLWIAGLFSSFSMSVFMFSEAWYVVQALGLEASLGFVYIASSVPRLVFMAIGGAVADRMSRSNIMFLSDMSRAILLVGLITLLLLGDVSLWTLVGLALVFGVLDAFFWPAQGSLLPSVVSKAQLTRANSVVQMTNQFSFITAPMLGGVIIEWGSYPLAFGTTSAMLFISGALVFFIRSAPVKTDGTEENGSLLKSIVEGLRYVKKSTFLTALFSVAVVLNLLTSGPMQMGLPLFVKNVLGGSTLDFSFLEGSLAAGMFIGSVVVGIMNLQKKRGQFALASTILMAIAFLLFSQTNAMWQSMVVIFIVGASMSAINIPLFSVVQSMVEKEMIGRIMSLLSMAAMGLIPVSYALTSLLLSFGINIDTIMLGGGIPLLLLTVFTYWKVPAIRTTD